MPPKRKERELWLAADEGRGGAAYVRPARETVGSLIRGAREQHGWTLDQMSAALRIRRDYLQAIEDDRHDRLPGRSYATGFVRTYAQALSLNAEEVVGLLKASLGDAPERRELVFPEPVTERRMPGGAILTVCVTLVIGVYATWYMQAAQNPLPRDLFPSVPAVAEDARRASEAEPTRLAMQPPMRPPPTTALSDRVVDPPQSRIALDARPGALPPATRLTATPYPPAVAPPAAQSVVPNPTLAIASPALQQPIEQYMLPPVSRGGGPAQAAEVPPGTQLAGLPVPERAPPRTGPARVELRAAEPTWIEVRSELTGEIVHGKLLRAGDSYLVPERPGLKLTTGNAGGLDIVIDGETLPRLGARGVVMRGIPLDSDRLLAASTARN